MAVVPRQRKNKVVYYVTHELDGHPVWERVGTDEREAKRREKAMKKELLAGTYLGKPTGAMTVGANAVIWFAKQTNRTVKDERRWWDRHVVGRCKWFTELRLEDVRLGHIVELLEQLKKPYESTSKYSRTATALGTNGLHTLAPKSISNLHGVVTRMFRDAQMHELIFRDPCTLPKGMLNRKTKKRRPYSAEHVIALTTDERIANADRMLLTIYFYTGMREGEGCGLRWFDWDRTPEPLTALTVEKQYEGRLLKTEKDVKGEATRIVPVHPELEKRLDEWWRTGFEQVYLRKPTPTDFIVPCRALHRSGKPYVARFLSNHTKSSAYKLFRRATALIGIESQTLHATRNTFVSFARRAQCHDPSLERVTHNASGEIIDVYTEFEWKQLCDAVNCVRFQPRAPRANRVLPE